LEPSTSIAKTSSKSSNKIRPDRSSMWIGSPIATTSSDRCSRRVAEAVAGNDDAEGWGLATGVGDTPGDGE
jgi:hypothetical protein